MTRSRVEASITSRSIRSVSRQRSPSTWPAFSTSFACEGCSRPCQTSTWCAAASRSRASLGIPRVTKTFAMRGSSQLADVLEDRARGQVPRRTRHGTARMGARPGDIQTPDVEVVPCARALLEHLAMEDVTAGDPKPLLELLGAEHESVDNPIRQLGAHLCEPRDRRVGRAIRVDVDREALAEE